MNRNVTAIILVVLAIGIYFTFTQSIIDAAGIEQGINNQYLEAIKNSETLIQQREKANKDYNSISAQDRDRLNKMIPSATNNIHLIVDLNDLALNVHQFSLKNIKAEVINNPSQQGAPVSSGGVPGLIASTSLAQVKITFAVNATYQQFMEFLRDVQSSLRILDVSRLSVKATDTGVYEFQVELRAYWLKS